MMESVQEWNRRDNSGRIRISLELEKPGKHPLDFAELCDVLFISQVYAEERFLATDMVEAVTKARGAIENKKYMHCIVVFINEQCLCCTFANYYLFALQ